MMLYSTWYGDSYREMADVWYKSAKANTTESDTVLCVESCPDKAAFRRVSNHVCGNTHKLRLWIKECERAIDRQENLVLMDADTFICNEINSAFDEDFDIGLTFRKYKIPFNAGVVFFKPTDKAMKFMNAWYSENMRLLNRRTEFSVGIKKYGGVNQASLANVLRNPARQYKKFDCATWNCEQSSWNTFSDDTRVVHVKSELRSHIFGNVRHKRPEFDRMKMIYDSYLEMP